METKELIEQLKSCGERRCGDCPDIECCIGPNWLLRKAAECIEELHNSGDILISRDALIKKIFPYGMPDNGNYPINAKAVMDAILAEKKF